MTNEELQLKLRGLSFVEQYDMLRREARKDPLILWLPIAELWCAWNGERIKEHFAKRNGPIVLIGN